MSLIRGLYRPPGLPAREVNLSVAGPEGQLDVRGWVTTPGGVIVPLLGDAEGRTVAVTTYPAHEAAITPDDNVDLAAVMVVKCVTSGSIAYVTAGGETRTRAAVAVGDILEVQIRRVLATGTTGTFIGFY